MSETKPRLIPLGRPGCQQCRHSPARVQLMDADDKPIGIYCPRCGNGLLRRLLKIDKRTAKGEGGRQ